MSMGIIGGAVASSVAGGLVSKAMGGGSSGSSSSQQAYANPFTSDTGLFDSTWTGDRLKTRKDYRLNSLQNRALSKANQYMGMEAPQFDQLQDLGTGFLNQVGSFDPYQAAQDQYNLLSPELLRQQEQDMLNQENRLFAQGRLGSTGGAQDMESLARAQEASRAQMMYDSWAQGQAAQQQMAGLGLNFASAAPSLQGAYGQLGSAYLNPALQIDQQALQSAQVAGGLAGAMNTGTLTQTGGPNMWDSLGSGLMQSGANMLGNVDWGSMFGGGAPSWNQTPQTWGTVAGSQQSQMLADQLNVW